MPKFELDCRTGMMKIKHDSTPPGDFLFRQVKRVHGALIMRNGITDDAILNMIAKVKSGTRNIRYLSASTKAEQEIAYFILRQFN